MALDHQLHNDENIPISQLRPHTLPSGSHPRNTLHEKSDLETGPAEYQGSLKSVHTIPKGNGTAYVDTDGRRRRKQSIPTSESGTEADDESNGTLLGLPAPSARLRKGLKDPTGSAIQSPILTPSYLDDENRRQGLEDQLQRYGGGKNLLVTDEENIKLRDKFTRKRRAELLRRVTETLLLGAVGGITFRGGPDLGLRQCMNELFSHASVILLVCSLYPFRVLRYNRTRTDHNMRAIRTVRIPAAFDPAPVLYPILFPILVARVLLADNPTVLLPNLVLSISSIPYQLIPFYGGIAGYSPVQWILSAVPIAVFDISPSSHLTRNAKMDVVLFDRWDPELLTLLYPLHRALLSTLGYLTTTSLLPAELQLLSVSLINLILLGNSPQALILMALVWIGGLSICVLCGHVLRWGVVLARVPSWRFQQSYPASKNASIVLVALNDSLGGLFSKSPLLKLVSIGVNDSDDEPERAKMDRRKKSSRKHTLSTGKAEVMTLKQPICVESTDNTTNKKLAANGHIEPFPFVVQRQRRHTLPSNVGLSRARNPERPSKNSKRSIFPTVKPSSFLSLTSPQATLMTWTYAIYVYSVVVTTIAFPIRIFISRWALQGQEPVGWALGYLFGDLARFRSLTVHYNLRNWISLPPHSAVTSPTNQADRIRYLTLGAANTRLLLIAYYVLILTLGLTLVLRLRTHVEVDTRRKVFHGMMVLMFLPTTFIDPCFCALALSLILALFLLLDLFRASQLPPFSKPLMHFLAPYVDGRDHRGPVVVSHIFLLIGCAIPLWLSLAATPRTGEGPWRSWDVGRRDLGMVSGVVCVGMGDAAASLVGRRYGRRRWCWSGGKSLEGSMAFALAVMLGLGGARIWQEVGGWEGGSRQGWSASAGKTAIAAAGASLTEAVLTGGNDNVVVPVVLWVLVKGLGI